MRQHQHMLPLWSDGISCTNNCYLFI